MAALLLSKWHQQTKLHQQTLLALSKNPCWLSLTAALWEPQARSHCHRQLLVCLPVLKQATEVKPLKLIVITSFYLN